MLDTLERPQSAESARRPIPEFPVIALPAPADVPAYLRTHYRWAYLDPRNVALLDRPLVVNIILWGNARRLRLVAFDEIEPGWSVLQAAHVYGLYTPELARHIGPEGRLEVIDVAPVQVARCREKLKGFANVTVGLGDAADARGARYDAACSFFLLHEVPPDYKRKIVDALLGSVVEGGKAVFVDYHRPHWAHPLKALMGLVFDLAEPFARELWEVEIRDLASDPGSFSWRKETYFGGLYQKVVARRLR